MYLAFLIFHAMFNDRDVMANNEPHSRCCTRGLMTSPCHASTGTCSAINISLGVIYAYRTWGNALSNRTWEGNCLQPLDMVIILETEMEKERKKEQDILVYATGLSLSSCFVESRSAFVPSIYIGTNANCFSAVLSV